jgi:choline dehydrogenase-like flavoprotein
MIEDARRLPKDTLIEADIAIIGAGAAGITIARELAGTNIQLCLIESGGLEFEQDTQNLYQGENGGRWCASAESRWLRHSAAAPITGVAGAGRSPHRLRGA